jgi:hypothetical protein
MLAGGNFEKELVLQITNTKAYHKVLGIRDFRIALVCRTRKTHEE